MSQTVRGARVRTAARRSSFCVDQRLAQGATTGQSALVQATVDISLTPSDRRFVLPASGTRSLLFRFGEDTFGGVLTDASNRDFQPGGDHAGASLDVWAADTSAIVVGTKFVIWYGGDIGRGVVTAQAAYA